MNTSDILSLITTVDELVFSDRGKHLSDMEQAILKGVFDHQKYSEIAEGTKRSEKYIKYVASHLWKNLSSALGEVVTKVNVRSTLTRYYYYVRSTKAIREVTLKQCDRCQQLLGNELSILDDSQQAKLETVPELIREGLSVEQIVRVLKLPLELVQSQIETAN